MKNKKLNATLIWKQLEDLVIPRLRLSVIDRAVYSHLLRHSRLEGKLEIRFSISWLARATRLCGNTVRDAVCRLLDHGALRLVQRSKAGHVVEVRLPDEIRAIRRNVTSDGYPAFPLSLANLEEADFLKTKPLRQAIHARECGRCFYCLRRLTSCILTIDHVVPRVDLGRNSYRNLVSCCQECNSHKGERPAMDFLRWLYRERRLSPSELAGRLRAIDALARGKLRPCFTNNADPLPRKGRPPLDPAKL
jgi:5-methylcytosine-specific restriction endonuclease McrA